MTQSSAPLRYCLRFDNPAQHLVEVEIRVLVTGNAPVELWMPVWTPGSYLVREYSRNVERFAAETPDGTPLPWRKTRKNSWEVNPAGAGEIVVRYGLYGRERSVRTNWIDDTYALIIGAATFLTVRDRDRGPHHVTVELPAGWTQIWTALPREQDGGAYVAPDLDTLIDAPILAGNPVSYPFEVAGGQFTLVNEGEGGLWDGAAATEHLKAIVAEYGKMYGGFPFERYLFLNMIVGGYGGLEHKDCCVMQTDRFAFRVRKEYVNWLGLASHEFFHVWNVKRSRPLELGPFDYQNEVYTRNLWVAEGLTAYYTDLVPCRAGVTTPTEYLGLLSEKLRKLAGTPGRERQSIEESSFDAWIKLYRGDENTANSTVSYYLKGAVVGWLLDVELRRRSEGARTLDDVMRILFERYSGDLGFTATEMQEVCEEVAGGSLQAFFDHAVRSTRELDYGKALAYLGLRFDPDATENGKPKSWMGIVSRRDEGRLLVASVRRDGPAWAAGLNAEDEILALGGYRVLPGELENRLHQYAPGERVEVLVSRGEAVRIVPLTLAPYPGNPWKLQADPGAAPGAVERRRNWLGRDL